MSVSGLLSALSWIGPSAVALAAVGLYLWERHQRVAAEALSASEAETSTANAVAAGSARVTVSNLELERAKRVVEAYQDAQAEAKKRTSDKDAADRGNAALGKLRLVDDDEGN